MVEVGPNKKFIYPNPGDQDHESANTYGERYKKSRIESVLYVRVSKDWGIHCF